MGMAVASMFGALALALLSAGTATAAQGTLIVSGTPYSDPSGCYNTEQYPLRVDNHTDELAIVFSGPECQGAVTATVPPGERGVFEFGESVYIR
ncbi:hypothetical protein HUT19_20855 [Streptomyces sp. NA02950]|uniref:hypothetical protein n=1 Tax=Streptomyces sp. NA02950 TaxID=2742137 RepID=UPI001590F57B|nr:hypothetical protein [Streptomyces sp. NA02950]QKV93908.1 hypothetical protein HUT19_20855 [Streptomyces sp. NA02950]